MMDGHVAQLSFMQHIVSYHRLSVHYPVKCCSLINPQRLSNIEGIDAKLLTSGNRRFLVKHQSCPFS